jgi:hypothetical protein
MCAFQFLIATCSILPVILPGILYFNKPYIPEENRQNHAQNSSSGDRGSTGDIIHTSSSTLYRLWHSNTASEYCNLKGDMWFMRQHMCRVQS